MCARPNDRIPGVSITHHRPSVGTPRTESRYVVPCRPRTRHRSPDRLLGQADSPTSTYRHRNGPKRGDMSVRSGSTSASESSRPAVITVRVQIGELSANGPEEASRISSGRGSAGCRRHTRAIRAPVDQARTRRRIGQCDDDQKLVGIRDHHSLGRVGVIRGAPQHSSSFAAADYPGESVGSAGQIADDDRRCRRRRSGASQFARHASRSPAAPDRVPTRSPSVHDPPTTMAFTASACSGRVWSGPRSAAGSDPSTSDSSCSRGQAGSQHPRPHPVKVRAGVLEVVAMSSRPRCQHPQPDDRAGSSHPVIGIRMPELPGCSGPRR